MKLVTIRTYITYKPKKVQVTLLTANVFCIAILCLSLSCFCFALYEIDKWIFYASNVFSFFGALKARMAVRQGLRERVQGVHRTRARAQGARKSSGFRVKFWYRTITP